MKPVSTTMKTTLALATTVLVLLAPAARAQRVLPITSGAAGARARGSEAALTNPALLALSPAHEILLAGLSAGAQNSAFSRGDYLRYNGNDLTDADKERILSLIGAEGMALGAEAGVGALALSAGRWSLATQTVALGQATLPRDLARLALFGNVENETYHFAGAEGSGAAWSALQFGYGAPLATTSSGWRVTGGLSAKYLRGWASAQVLQADGQLTTTIEAIDGSGELLLRTARGGSGFSTDLGLAARRGELLVSLALTDALSRLAWNNRPELRHALFTAHQAPLAEADEVGDVVNDSTWTEPTAAFHTSLPRRLTLGFGFPLGPLEASAAVSGRFGGGFNDVLRGSAGLVWPVSGALSLGGGLAVGGSGSSAASTGLLLHAGPVKLDLSVAARGTPLFWQAHGYGVAFGLGFGY